MAGAQNITYCQRQRAQEDSGQLSTDKNIYFLQNSGA